jgi:hypothetical protein
MSSRSTCALLLVLLCGTLYGQDWEGFAASSDHSADPVILQTMAAGVLETNIALCRGIARRSDPDAHAIIEYLAAGQASRTSLGSELLLRYLLQGVLAARTGEAPLRDWAAANAVPLDLLLAMITQWKSPQLKGILLKFALIAPGQEGMHAIVEVGALVVAELGASPDGLIPSQDAALALDFLSAAHRSARPEFLPYCTDIARLSRDAVIVAAARAAAVSLAAAPRA